MIETAHYDLFISYAEADRAWVEGYLLDALEQAGTRVHSEAAFALGVPRVLEFERAIRQSRRTLLVLSPAYLADSFGQFTDLMAGAYGLETSTWPVIPLILQPIALPARLATLQSLDGTDPAGWPTVVARLCAEAERPVAEAAPAPECPYPGMTPFREADSARFFGREREVRELVERLRLHPFITVIGPSGSGKSSLVSAGLLPALRQSRLFGAGEWLMCSMRPGEMPMATLAGTLAPRPRSEAQVPGGDLLGTLLMSSSAAPPATINSRTNIDPARDLASDPAAAVQALLSTAPGARRLLLVVDQFEETFTVARTDAALFQQTLLRLADLPECYVVLTVRADFYPDLMVSPLWPSIQSHRMEVVPLSQDGLRQAVVRPAENAGVFVEAALVERLVADAADEPGALPLIQETLVLLWERLERRFLPLRAYNALVLPRSAYDGLDATDRTGLQVALARRADAALAALAPDQQAIARRIVLRLIAFGEGRPDTRRQQPVSELRVAGDDPLLFERTLRHLADSRLLTLGGHERGTGRQVDIAHEALIRGWPTLQGWLRDRREAEQIRRRLEDKAAEWIRMGRGSSGLFDDVELLEAERWLAGSDAADLGFSPILPDVVNASRAAIEHAKRMRVEAQQRELTLAQQGRHRLQAIVAILSSLLLIGAAWIIQPEIQRQRARAGGEMRLVSGLNVAFERYEVTNARYKLCVDIHYCLEPLSNISTLFHPDAESLPVTGIDAIQAAAFCHWVGRRLPTLREWQHVATQNGLTTWPWGTQPPTPAYANLLFDETAQVVVEQPDQIGRHSQGTSPDGINDVIGNVQEWTASPPDHPENVWDGQSKSAPDELVVVGGDYNTPPGEIVPISDDIGFRYSSLGFRCVETR